VSRATGHISRSAGLRPLINGGLQGGRRCSLPVKLSYGARRIDQVHRVGAVRPESRVPWTVAGLGDAVGNLRGGPCVRCATAGNDLDGATRVSGASACLRYSSGTLRKPLKAHRKPSPTLTNSAPEEKLTTALARCLIPPDAPLADRDSGGQAKKNPAIGRVSMMRGIGGLVPRLSGLRRT
jgi:hypothetical protein